MTTITAYADNSGFYVGVGSGINQTMNSNMKYEYNANNQPTVQNLGNVTENSTPLSLDVGYKFNNFLAAELLYSYSGNQNYSSNNGTFWGSQNILALDAVGFFPILSNVYIKGRLGIAGYKSNLTNYVGNPNTTSLTSSLGAGIEYRFIKNIALDFDFINYGLINPVNLQYQPCNNCQNIGSAGTQQTNLYLLSLQYYF